MLKDTPKDINSQNYELIKVFLKYGATVKYFESMLDVIIKYSDSEFGFIAHVLDDPSSAEKKRMMRSLAETDISWNEEVKEFYKKNTPLVFRNQDTLFGACLKTMAPVFASNFDARRGGVPRGHPAIDTFMAVPIVVNNDFLAMVGLANRPEGYSQDTIDMLSPLIHTLSHSFQRHKSKRNAHEGGFMISTSSTQEQGLLGRVNYISDSLVELLGYDTFELMRANTIDIIANDSLQHLHSIIDALRSKANYANDTYSGQGNIARCQVSLSKKGGGDIHLEGLVSLELTAVHRESGLLFELSNPASSLSRPRAFDGKASEFANYCDQANLAFIALDRNEKITLWNNAMVSLTGFSELDVLGRAFLEFSPICLGVGLGRDNADQLGVEISFRTRREKSLLISGNILRTSHNETYIVGVDNTATAGKAEQQSQSQRLQSIGSFSAGLSHDLNNMLTIVRGNLELVSAEENLSAAVVEMIGDATKACEDAMAVTRKVLRFSRPFKQNVRSVPLNKSVSNIVKFAKRVVPENITIDLDFQDNFNPLVSVDDKQLENALLNIIINAMDALHEFCESTPKITVSVSKGFLLKDSLLDNKDYALIDISDNGAGMSPVTLSRVMEPYFTTKTNGTGLGMANAHGLVNETNGEINISSIPQQGTSVKIYLPVVIGDLGVDNELHKKSVVSEHDIKRRSINNKYIANESFKRVLIVDDNSSVLKSVIKSLEKWGFETNAAQCPDEALDWLKFKNHSIDFVLSDIVMPGSVSGRQMLRSIKLMYPAIQGILMSGYDSTLHSDLDAEPILIKPFNRESFFEKYHQLVDNIMVL